MITKKSILSHFASKGYAFRSILGTGNNAKTAKSDLASDYLTAIAYLGPDLITCPFSKVAGCAAPCLNLAGRGSMHGIQRVRHDRTAAYHNDKGAFLDLLWLELNAHRRRCAKLGKLPAVRLNGTADIDFTSVMREFPSVQFYDYTKHLSRVRAYSAGDLPPNYHLTLSWSGASKVYADRVRERLASDPDLSTAVVFRTPETVAGLVGSELLGRTVIDGDKTDLRFTDPAGSIVALYAKGPAKKDDSGFVVDCPATLAD